MKPSKLKKLKLQDILISLDSYSDGVQRTTVGWLQEFFLFHSADEYIQITTQDSSDYQDGIDRFKKLHSIHKNITLEFWEDKTSKKQQLESLNNFIEACNATATRGKKTKKKTQEENS